MKTIAETKNNNAAKDSEISPENYAFLQKRIYTDSGIVLDESKQYLIESRLMPIVRKENLGSLNDLCALLRAVENTPVRKHVVEAMTTNETFFFRDTPVFDALRDIILPELVKTRSATRTLNIWSAAASKGQEAYSVAMLLLEMGLPGWKIRILGTDLNDQILDQARNGRYLQLEANRGLPAKLLVKYFDRVGLDWQIKSDVRKLVEFRMFDLRKSMKGLGIFDLVLCRNVLIYFDVQTKKQILMGLRGVLANQAYLGLGSAETTMNLDDSFTRKLVGQAAFYETR